MSAPTAPDPALLAPGPLLLELEFARAEQADDPFAYRFVPQDYHLRQAGGRIEVARFDWTSEVQTELQNLRLPGREPSLLQRIGGRLRTFLQGTSWSAQEVQISEAVAAGRGVVLTLRSAAAELYTLPWELLTLRDTGQHLGELPGFLLRYEWPGTRAAAPEALARRESARILFAWSAAGGSVPAPDHTAAMRSSLPAGSPLFVSSRDVLANASYASLSAQLEAAARSGPPIAVLHLLCHGSTSGQSFGLLLDGSAVGEGPAWINAGRLRQLLAPYASMLRLVVLCACDSANAGALGNQLGSIAQVLHRVGIPQVIASRYPLSVAGSLRFTSEFYAQLLDRLSSSESAFLSARRQLALDTAQIDWASLQLYQHAESGTDSRPITLRPYRGLLAYGPEHGRFFFGRDAEIAEILADAGALLASGAPRLLAIDGASGTGKSSVLFAGALSSLLTLLSNQYSAPARVVRLRPGSAPRAALEGALGSDPVEETAARPPTLLIVDQFEEVFTQTADPRERREFAQKLWALATARDSATVVVITLRSDFVGHCGELVLDEAGLRLDRVIYQDGHRVSIARMSPLQLRQVIEGPAGRVGLRLQAGLVERMLHDVDREAGALPLVADTLDLLWQRRVGQELTQQAYDQIGGVTGALQGRADQALIALPEREQRQARRLLVRLGRAGTDLSQGVRLRVQLAGQRPPGLDDAAAFEHMLAALVEARLLIVDHDQKGSEATVEIAHEALLRGWPRLAQWLAEDAQLLTELDVIEGWVRQFQDHQSLLTPPQLERANGVFARHPEAQTRGAAELVARSREQQEAAAERDRFARDCLRMLAVQELDGDPTRQVAILRETESQTPTAVPRWLPYAVDILQSGLLLRTELASPRAAIERLAIRPDGGEIVLGLADGSLAQARVADDALRPLAEPMGAVSALAYGPEGSVLCGCSDGVLRVIPGSGAAPRLLRGHRGAITALACRPRSPWLASASVDGTIRLWGPSEQCVTLSGARGAVRAIDFSPDGSLLGSAGEEGLVRMYSLDSLGAGGPSDKAAVGKPEVLDEHEGPVRSLAFAATGKYALTLGEDGTACLWDEEGDARIYGEKEENVSAAVFSADGLRILLGYEDGTVREHALDGKMTLPPPLIRGEGEVLALAVSPDGAWLAALFDDDYPVVCHLHSRGQVYWLGGHLGTVTGLTFSPDSRSLITLCDDGKARSFDLARPGLYVPRRSTPEQERGDFHLATAMGEGAAAPTLTATSADGQLAISAERDGAIRIRGPGGAARTLPAQGGAITTLRLAPDGKHLVTLAADGQARLWRLGDGSCLILPGHRGAIGGLDVSRDGGRVVLGGADGKVRVYSATAGTLSGPVVFEGHRAGVTLAAFAPEGERILTMSQDGSTRLWREAGRCEVLIEGVEDHGELEEFGVALSRDWSRIITQHSDGLRLIWDLDLDPAALRARLWQATPFCLSAAERERYLREPGEIARQRAAESLAQARAVAASPERRR